MKLFTIVGTRPELIRLAEIMRKADKFFDHKIVHTGQNHDYELNEIFFNDLNIRKPDYFLNSVGKTPMETISKILYSIDKIFEKEIPDAILILGDTNSSLCAIPAKRKKIPIFHMEAGNRCFDSNVPEEINRRIVDHISDINLPYSQISREHLISEGIKPQNIIVTGSPLKEVITKHQNKVSKSYILKKLKIKKNDFILVSSHREENVDSRNKLKDLINCLTALKKKYKKEVIFSTHPRTKNKLIEFFPDLTNDIQFLKPFGFIDYLKLQLSAFITLSDSGTITEESNILGFNAINLRESHERPEGFEQGGVIFAGYDLEKIISAIDFLTSKGNTGFKTVLDYDVDDCSTKIIKIIMSYISYVNKYTWFKELK